MTYLLAGYKPARWASVRECHLRIGHDPEVAQLSGKVSELLREAEALVTGRGHFIVGTEHVLLAMTRQTDESFARRLLDEVGATEPLRARIEAAIGEG